MTAPADTLQPTREPAGGLRQLPAPARAIIATLAVTATVGYGCLYYSFAVFLVPVAADLHASTTAVTGAFTAAVLTTALMAVPVGRWLDRHGSHLLMTLGSLAGTLLLLGFSRVSSLPQLYAVWIGLGAAGSMVFYEPVFATVIAWTDRARRAAALLAVTVVAGFASSIFLPLTGLLVDRHGWRAAALVLAAIHGVITIPLHALVLRRPSPLQREPRDRPAQTDRAVIVRSALHDRRFWLLALAFTAQAVALSSMTIHLVGFLTAEGHPTTFAATVAGGLGVLSVAGRLVVTGLQRRFSVATVTATVFATQGLAAAALPVIAASRSGAIVGVILFGLGFGVSTIARPALLSELFGTVAYATLAGLVAAPFTLAAAAAPLATAALHQSHGGYTPVLLTIAAACTTSATGAALLRRGDVPAQSRYHS